MTTHRIAQGAFLVVLAELFLVISGMIVKQVTNDLPTEVIVFARNLFGFLLLLPWLFSNGITAIVTSSLHLHMLRAAVGVTAMMCLYYSWGHLPLAEAAMIKQTAPFFIPLFAFWWLGERIAPYTIVAILIGFVGVFLILKPSGEGINLVAAIAFFGAVLGGLAKVVLRRMSTTEPPQRIVFYFALFSMLLSAVPAWFSWVTPDFTQLCWLVLMALTSTLAQLCLSKGYGLAPAGQLGPFTYASVAFAALFGWLIWEEVLGLNSWLGVLLIFAAGVFSTGSVMKKRSVRLKK